MVDTQGLDKGEGARAGDSVQDTLSIVLTRADGLKDVVSC